MGVFNFLRGPDINQGVKEYGETGGALLLDVRTPQEYRAGHIPGSKTSRCRSLTVSAPRPAGRTCRSLCTAAAEPEAGRL